MEMLYRSKKKTNIRFHSHCPLLLYTDFTWSASQSINSWRRFSRYASEHICVKQQWLDEAVQ